MLDPMRAPWLWWVSSMVALAACGDEPGNDQAGAPPSAPIVAPEEFIAFVADGEHRAELRTATVGYLSDEGAEIDLIGVVHLGDQGYYDALDASFAGYDAVLYEMIKPARAAPVGPRDDGSPLSLMQRGLCRALGLVFQLDSLDYGRANFVHADLTAERFAELWEERDESFLRIVMRAMAASAGQQSGLTPAALFEAARSPARQAKLKLLLGREFANIERTLAGLGEVGADGRDRSMLLGERNAAAVEVLRARLAAGDRKIALVYGAAHGPDLDLRIVEDLGLRRRALRWSTAWRIDAGGG
jgi:hypothetical protein